MQGGQELGKAVVAVVTTFLVDCSFVCPVICLVLK